MAKRKREVEETTQIITTLGNLVNAEAALRRLAALPLQIKTAFHVVKLLRVARLEIDQFNQQREATIKELGTSRPATEDERSTGYGAEVTQVKPEHVEEFTKRINELAQVSLTLPLAHIKLGDLGEMKVSAADLLALETLVIE